jgi:Do/DeqQ family serine protease
LQVTPHHFMNHRIFSSFPAASAVALAFGLAVAARADGIAPAPAPAPVKMPELKTDFTPVDNGSSAPIASYADIVEPVRRAVVSIKTSKTVHEHLDNPILRQFFGDTPDEDHTTKEVGLGSGVIVSSDGFILTNNHVVEDADELTVVLSDDREFPAKVVGSDPKTDVAVVKIDTTGLQAITFADSDKLRVGDVVFAVGNPLDVGETVTMGIVSAKSRNVHILDDVAGYEDFIQTDAAINLGNSGGALVDAKGRLVGINSAIVSPSRGNIGIGFAVPVNLAAGVMKSLIETGTVTRGFLGVGSEPLTPEVAEQVHLPGNTKGVIITDVIPEGPAAKAGVQLGDVILKINGKEIQSRDELRLTIAEMPPGSKVSIDLSRDGKPVGVNVVLTQFADAPNELLSGVQVDKINDEARKRFELDPRITGVVVTDVKENSEHAEDLPVGAVIIEINRVPVADVETARASLHPGHNLLLVSYRGYQRYIVVTVR